MFDQERPTDEQLGVNNDHEAYVDAMDAAIPTIREQYREAYRLQRACAAMAQKSCWMGAQQRDLVRWYFTQVDSAKINPFVEVEAMRSWLMKNPLPSNWTNIQIAVAVGAL